MVDISVAWLHMLLLSSSMPSGDYRVQVSPFSCAWLEELLLGESDVHHHTAVVDYHLACLSRLWLFHWHNAIGISFCHVTLRSFYQSCDFMNLKTTVSRHRRIFLVMWLEHQWVLTCSGWQHSVCCRTVLQTNLLPFHIVKWRWEICTSWICFCSERLAAL